MCAELCTGEVKSINPKGSIVAYMAFNTVTWYSNTIIYICIVFNVIIYSPGILLLFLGLSTKSNIKIHPFRRAGGARADDNFTKKPQKKLIRYIVLF